MKLIILSLFTILSTSLVAQNNLVVFTQESKPFYVVVNGIRQNMKAETNVKIENLPGTLYKVKAVFADGKTPDVDKSINFMEKNEEYSLEIVEKRGKYKMRFAGFRAINESVNTGSSVTYHEDDWSENTNSVNTNVETTQPTTVTNSSTNQTNTSSSTSSQQTNVSTENNSQTNGVNTNVGVTNNGASENVGVNIDMNSSGVSIQVDLPEDQMQNLEQNHSMNSSEVTTNYSFIQTGTMCASPNVSQRDFINFKYTLENANMFKREELITAYFNTHCMLSNQVAGLIQLNYATVDAKKIAKQGYRYTYDTENYNLVIDALNSFEDKTEVLTFIEAGTITTSVTQTTSSTSSTTNTQISSSSNGQVHTSSITDPQTTANNQHTTTETNQYSQLQGYSGYVNCGGNLLMDISDVKKRVAENAFADAQRKAIQTATNKKCLSVEQVGELAAIFSHESDQLDFMKWAFDKTYDIDNFYKLTSQLTFSSSKEALDAFIDEQPTAHFYYVFSSNSDEAFLIDESDLKKRMENEAFSDNKLDLAKQALVSRYISTNQIKSLIEVFSHEGDKLTFLQMAYPRTTDQVNFDSLRELLVFDSSKNKFDQIIK